MDTFYFYDLETTGIDARWHRIVQFAGIRTDADLDPVEEPVTTLVRLDDDVVPDPEAALVTGLTPGICAQGISEYELFRQISREFSRPRTCVVGYNNLRFDDEFIRHGLWRNLRDPYAREWQSGNSRWDLIDLTRMAAALRPEGIQWPEEDGRRVFRLEALASANDITQERAHDAMDDVIATLGLARLLRQAQPRLFDWYLGLRSKRAVSDLVLPVLGRAFVHVSGRYSAERGALAVVASVAPHPVNRNSVIVADLGVDPQTWAHLSAADMREALFAPAADRGDAPRPPLKEVHLNKVPAVAPIGVLDDAAAERWQIDGSECERTLAALRAMPDLAERVREVYTQEGQREEEDPDGRLYGGFLPDADRDALVDLKDAESDVLAAPGPIKDDRVRELVFRQRARRFPQSLSPSEQERWAAHVRARLGANRRGMDGVATAARRARQLRDAGKDPTMLADLLAYYEQQSARWDLPLDSAE